MNFTDVNLWNMYIAKLYNLFLQNRSEILILNILELRNVMVAKLCTASTQNDSTKMPVARKISVIKR